MAPPRSSDMTHNDERRPLLRDRENQRESVETTPLPTLQLGVLCLLRIIDPLNFTQIFPYINQLIVDLHVTEDLSRVGFYSGVVESVFALCQLFAIYPWASLSDKIGRRPVIIAGTLGLAFSTLAFGISQTFVMILATRAISGLFSGNVSVIPSILCEITDETNQCFAFPFFGLWWPVGLIVGPLIGGSLAQPVARYPEIFEHTLFKTFPYLLPCLVVSTITLLATVVAYFFLEETVKLTAQCSEERNDISTKTLLKHRMIQCLSLSACFISFVTTGFDVLFVLFCYLPVEKGGLALPTDQIGYALSITGTMAALLQLLCMPTLLRRLDHARFYHYCVMSWPLVFLALPALNVLARYGADESTGVLGPRYTVTIWLSIVVILALARIGSLPYCINTLLIKKYAPKPVLGSCNGLIQFFICLSRAFSPIAVSTIFSLSIDHDFFGGHLWAIAMAVVSVGGCYFSGQIVAESQKLNDVNLQS